MKDEQKKHLSADTVTAKSFCLVDDEENVRARLSTVSNSSVTFDLYDTNGCPRMVLQLDEQGNPHITLWAKNSSLTCSIASHSDNGNGITIFDNEGKPQIILGVPESCPDSSDLDETHITVLDREGRIIWSTTYED